ncbi:hypothetical protein F5Y16DRAFT_421858 [Xylariaceae sp. FL0255]|nr:hypothetical protein F5Y16DRAFT_421858 [Xylariaceae sp. FL0255]
MTIKYDSKIDGQGSGDFVNADKLKESTVSFLISVSVVNQTITDEQLIKFCPIDELGAGDFTEVYGDSFVSANEDWTFETLRKAAVKFPDYVAKTPIRTHVLLTKYTSLRSFLALGNRFAPMVYENAGGYTTMLQELFAEYKTLLKYIQTMSNDFDAGRILLQQS